jgi:threonine efflux protein
MIEIAVSKLPALLTAWTAFGLAAISPGPNMLAVMARAFGSGRRAAVSVAAGIAIGAFMWAMATAFGLAIIAERFPWVVPVTGLIGGVYLTRMGILRYLTMRRDPAEPPSVQIDGSSVRKAMWQGFAVIASNPKVAMFWISISAFIVKSDLGTPGILVFAVVCSLLAFTIYAIAATVFSNARMRALYFRVQQPVDLCFAALFVAIGLYLLWFSIGLLK